MPQGNLASQLVQVDKEQQVLLLKQNSALADVSLAHALKDICLAGWSSDTARAIEAASALRSLAKLNPQPEIISLSFWGSGLEELIHGRNAVAIEQLEKANEGFLELNKPHLAAATQVSKLIALAYLGRYEEAIQNGLLARKLFIAEGDLQAVGRIEHNIGNLYFRRDQYHEAEVFQTSARERFLALNDQKQLATVNNCLANTHALLHKFQSAEELYEQAVKQAEESGLPVTLAGIEGNIGTFALLQGRYDRSLDYLERSRRRYESLGMTHQAVTAEHEIADAYVELRLASEAIDIYRRLLPKFVELGMRAEYARALAYLGRALILLGEVTAAISVLDESRELYAKEGNKVGEATVKLAQAQLQYNLRNYGLAKSSAKDVEIVLEDAGSWHQLLLARWLQADSERALGYSTEAESILQQTLKDSEFQEQPQIAERCYTSLGLIAFDRLDYNSAEENFERAVELIEKLRAPLPGEEFRAAFFSDKLVPYVELVRLHLQEGRAKKALRWAENARSRALAETLGGNLVLLHEPRDSFEAELAKRIEILSEELNYIYNQIHRPFRSQSLQAEDLAALQQQQAERERTILKLNRQLQHRGRGEGNATVEFDLASIQQALGHETALLEYTMLDDEVLVFLVTDETIQVFRHLITQQELAEEITQFRFQVDALRHGSASIRKHISSLKTRTVKRLSSLYDKLVRPLNDHTGARRLAIVPHRELHYLPFQALHDGEQFLIEQHEISYAPSAVVLKQCLDRDSNSFNTALLLATDDARIPRAREEVQRVARLFSQSEVRLGKDATKDSLRDLSRSVDVLHLACHAHFRIDNPLFSALQLSNGWFTVRDAYKMKLRSSLVTLSACETGVNAVSPGDELIGLARGFLSAGAPSIVLSLWTVDDESATELMTRFYESLLTSGSPAKALRVAQVKMLKEQPHPFFWSPFAVMGRW